MKDATLHRTSDRSQSFPDKWEWADKLTRPVKKACIRKYKPQYAFVLLFVF